LIFPPRPDYIEPETDAKVWRYLDFAKFADLILRSALFFPRADQLGDEFEGAVPRAYQKRADFQKHYAAQSAPSVQTALQRMWYVSCWHALDYESAAMWQIYAGRGLGLAIQTTYGRLKDSIPDEQLPEALVLSLVRYIDYDSEEFSAYALSETLSRFLYKRRSLEYEHELRLLTQPGLPIEGRRTLPIQESTPGILIPVQLDVLIEEVFVAPKAAQWFHDLVRAFMKRLGLNDVPVQWSRMDSRGLK
jgi:hypothetical protein